MKIISLFASIFFSLLAIGQKSYYFSEPLPSSSASVMSIDKKWYGKYKEEGASRTIIIDEDGIYVESTNISSVSRELIRESSTYDVRDGYIFGVVKGDSLPCVLEGERYYFGIKNVEKICGEGTANVLTKSPSESNVYYINSLENGYYLPIKLSFERNALTVAYFDYDINGAEFAFIEKQKSIQTEFHELVVLTPTVEEINKLLLTSVFSNPKAHKKTR